MAQITCILVVLGHLSYKNGPKDLVRGFFLSLDIGHISVHLPALVYFFLVHLGVPKWPQNSQKT